MPYLLHSSLLLAACFLYYRFALRSETYFQLNRWLLLGCVVASFTLPLITVPAAWSLRANWATAEEVPARTLDQEVPREVLTTSPSTESSTPDTTASFVPANRIDRESREAGATAKTILDKVNWPSLLGWLYLAGILVFGFQFLLQIGTLFVRMLRHPGHDLGDFRLVEIDEELAPYSFWNRIFLNPRHYDPDTFHRIVEHEQIHVNQKHSLDILLAELLIVVQWFNPFAWWYRGAIEDNLEFLTDAEMLARGTDPTAYQLSLVQVAVPNHPQGLTSNYNQTFLEKRIKMMKTKKSSNRSAWKYLALLPLLVFSVLQLNAIDQPVASPYVAATPAPSPRSIVQPKPMPQPQPQVNPKPNPKPVVKADAKVQSTPAPKTEMQTEFDRKHPAMADARQSWTATIEGREVCFQFMVRSDRNNWQMNTSRCIPKADLGTLPGTSMGTFSLTREAGTMNFKGIFDGIDGLGTFEYLPAEGFQRMLRREGYRDFDDRELMHFFFADFNEDYLKFVKAQGYQPNREQLFHLAIFFEDQAAFADRLQYIKKEGYAQPNLDRLIELQIHGISSDYIEEMNQAGYGKLTLDEIKQAKIHGLSTNYLKELKSIGFEALSFDEAKSFAIHGVSADYAKELNEMGFNNLSQDDVLSARIHGMSLDYLNGMRSTGLPLGDFDDVLQMKIHGVSPDFIHEIRKQGYDQLTIEQFTTARIHGISPSFIRSFQKLGLGEISFDDLVSMRIHGVTSSFIKKHRDKGDSVDDFVSMRIHGRY